MIEQFDLLRSSPRQTAIDELHRSTAIYTRELVVKQLLDHLDWPHIPKGLVDTSCGDGAFLGCALERQLDTQVELADNEFESRLSGWEIHPIAAEQARNRLADIFVSRGYDRSRARRISHSMVHCADFLTEGPRKRTYGAIVGNPPYLRFVNVPDPLRREYAEILPVYARADLLHSFLDRCAQLLDGDGELAMVTADRWLFNMSAARLREVIGTRFGISHIERLDVASTFYRPKQRRAGTPPRVHPVAVVLKPKSENTRFMGKAPIFPGRQLYAPTSSTRTLGDVAEIRLAPWLGTAGIFVIDECVAESLPAEYLVPAIDTDDIVDGVLKAPRRKAILTYPDRMPDDRVLSHLCREMPRMCVRGRRRSSIWLPPETFHRFDLTQETLLVPRIAKNLRPVLVPAGILPINHNLSIVRAGSMPLEHIKEVLNSPAALEWVKHHAAPLENEYYSLTTSLLRKLPVELS